MRPIKALFSHDPHYFKHVEGLRALAGLMLVWYQFVLILQFHMPLANFVELSKHKIIGTAMASSVCLDIFFLVSGLVVGYTLFKEMYDNNQLLLRRFYFRRLTRIIPSYLFVIVLCVPVFHSNLHNAWTNLLLINNHTNFSEQYLPWTWPIALTGQFYIIFSVFLLMHKKWPIPKKALHALAKVLIILPIAITLWLSLRSHNTYVDTNAYLNTLSYQHWYINTVVCSFLTRFGPMIQGVIASYIIIFQRKRLETWIQKTPAETINGIFAWLIILAGTMIVLDPWWSVQKGLNNWHTTVVWSILSRNIFTASLAGMILLCHKPKGFVFVAQKILALRFWRIFGQLSFNTFLINPVISMFVIGWAHYVMKADMTVATVSLMALKSFAITYAVAAFLYCWIEIPAMEKLSKWWYASPGPRSRYRKSKAVSY